MGQAVQLQGFLLMIVRQFLRWIKTAQAADRAAATNALARAYLQAQMDTEDKQAAEAAMTLLLDDVSPLVRTALAEGLAHAAHAPRHIILALAVDQPEISGLILRRSPALLDAELVDFFARGDERVQQAIAERRPLSMPLAAAICEVGEASACVALLGNESADIAVFSLARLVERLGRSPLVRELLLARDDLPIVLRQRLIADLSSVLGDFLTQKSWLSPVRVRNVTREALDKATLFLAQTPQEDARGELIEYLAQTQQLTPVLLLRSLCAGNVSFFEEVLAHLSGLPLRRVYMLVNDRAVAGFHALYKRCQLPDAAYPAFRAVLDVLLDTQMDDRAGGQFHFSRRMLERVLTLYSGFALGETDHLLLLLRRFAADAAREEARQFAERYVAGFDEPALLQLEGPQAA